MNKLINQLVEKGPKETSALHTTIERIKVYANCINTHQKAENTDCQRAFFRPAMQKIKK